MLPAFVIQETAMLSILLTVQNHNHRSSTLLHRLRSRCCGVMRTEIRLREARTVAKKLVIVVLVNRVTEDPGGAQHVQRSFAREVRNRDFPVRPVFLRHTAHEGDGTAAAAVIDDARRRLRLHEKGPEGFEHQCWANHVGLEAFLHLDVEGSVLLVRRAYGGIVDESVESGSIVSGPSCRLRGSGQRTSRTCCLSLWRVS